METLPKVLSKTNSKRSHTNPTHSIPVNIFITIQDEKTCINTHYNNSHSHMENKKTSYTDN